MRRWIAAIAVLAVAQQACAQNFDQAVDKAHKYTVQIKVSGTRTDRDPRDRYGTGVLLSSDGFIATAAHVVGAISEWVQKTNDGPLLRQIQVRVPDTHGILDGLWRDAILIKDDAQTDVAMIWIKGSEFSHAECRTLQVVRGTKVFRLGFLPDGTAQFADEKEGETSAGDSPQTFHASMVSQKGMSGGPAIDEAGNVLGLSINREDDAYFPSQSFTNFVRIEQANDLLPAGNSLPGCRRDFPASSNATLPTPDVLADEHKKNDTVVNAPNGVAIPDVKPPQGTPLNQDQCRRVFCRLYPGSYEFHNAGPGQLEVYENDVIRASCKTIGRF
jgi:hypothetical protein